MKIFGRPVAMLALTAFVALFFSQDALTAGGRALQAGTDRPVILAVGESTTAGYGVPAGFSYPAQLQQALDERGYSYRVVNQGVSGSTTRMAVSRLTNGMLLLPKIVIIALGGNDRGSTSADETRRNLTTLITMYKRTGAQVFLAARAERNDSLFADLAAEHGAILMPPLLTGVSGNPELLIEDGRHPNAAGYTVIVGNLLPILEPYLAHPAADPTH